EVPVSMPMTRSPEIATESTGGTVPSPVQVRPSVEDSNRSDVGPTAGAGNDSAIRKPCDVAATSWTHVPASLAIDTASQEPPSSRTSAFCWCNNVGSEMPKSLHGFVSFTVGPQGEPLSRASLHELGSISCTPWSVAIDGWLPMTLATSGV